MQILFKFPTRERPKKALAAIDNIIANARSQYTILLSLDSDDATMNRPSMFKELEKYGDNVIVVFGHSTSKVAAINRDIEKVKQPWDIICLHSDDMVFIEPGFDLHIIEAMKRHFPDTDGMLHFPDQQAGAGVCTYQIVGRKYYDRTGYIYNPVYQSLFCDNEETEKAKLLGKYAFINMPILEHRHPVWGFGQPDRLLRKTERYWNRDKAVYNKRKAENFGL